MTNYMKLNTMAKDVWDEKLYTNWVRGAKGLEFLQEGLKDFVITKAQVCRDQILQKITNRQCNQCNSQNLLPEHADPKNACNRTTCLQQNASNCLGSKPKGRRKCPNGICSKLYDEIVLEHRFRDPLWKNTDPSTWCSDPQGWSYMKCFESTQGPGASAHETDASGLLSILINNLSMQNWLACQNMDSTATCPFYKARDIRNGILHKPKLELDDQTLAEYIDTFITVLQDAKCLLTFPGSLDAVNKLKQLKSREIHITHRDKTKILTARGKALAELEERKQGAIQEIEDTTTAGMSKINKATTDAVREIKDMASKTMSAKDVQIMHCTSLSSSEARGCMDWIISSMKNMSMPIVFVAGIAIATAAVGTIGIALSAFCFLIFIFPPMILHIFAFLIASWTSDRYCDFGLFWASCSDRIQDLETETSGFGWSVTVLEVVSNVVLCCLCCQLLMMKWCPKTIVCCFLTAGLLDLLACYLIRSNCIVECQLGLSYHLTWIAAWLMILVVVIPAIFICIGVVREGRGKIKITLQRRLGVSSNNVQI